MIRPANACQQSVRPELWRAPAVHVEFFLRHSGQTIRTGGMDFLRALVAFLSIQAFLVHSQAACLLSPQPPSHVNEPVAFQVACDAGESPEIAWEFGDSDERTPYSQNLHGTHIYTSAGEYNVFARIKGKLIPLSTLHRVIHSKAVSGRRFHNTTISWNRDYTWVWAVNTDNHSITGIRAGTWERVEIPVGREPRNLAVDKNGQIWVTNQKDATVSIVSRQHKTVLKTLILPYASRPFGIICDTVRHRVYISLEATGEVAVIDGISMVISEKIAVFPSPRGLALDADRGRLYVSRFISPEERAEVAVLNTSPLSLHKIIPLADDLGPNSENSSKGIPNALSAIILSKDGRRLFIPSTKTNTEHGFFKDGESLSFETTVRTIVSQIDIIKEWELLDSRFDLDNHSMLSACEEDSQGDVLYCVTQGTNTLQGLVATTDSGRTTLRKYRSYEPDINRGFRTEMAPKGLAIDGKDSLAAIHFFMSREVGFYDISALQDTAIQKVRLVPTVTGEELSPAALKGKQVFYNAEDIRMTKEGYISCAVCHLDGGTDGRVWDFTERGEGLRFTTSLLGRGGMKHGPVHHTANFDEIQDFEHDIRNAFLGTGFIPDEVFNSGTRNTPLGAKKTGYSAELDALAAYLSSLTEVNPSPFRNPGGTMTDGAKRGQEVFTRADVGCVNCHSGPDFTDSRLVRPFRLHDVGTFGPGSGKRLNDTLKGFDTPTLKGIWQTAPYLHDGSAPTLMDVITVKNPADRHGKTSHLSKREIADLVRFLKELDDTEPAVAASTPTLGAREGAIPFIRDNTLFLPIRGRCQILVLDLQGNTRFKARGNFSEWRIPPIQKSGVFILKVLHSSKTYHLKYFAIKP